MYSEATEKSAKEITTGREAPSRSVPYLWIEFPICLTCFHDSQVFAPAIHRKGISFPFVVSAPPACGLPEVLASDCMEMLRPVSPIRRQDRRRAYAATNDDECLGFLSPKEEKKSACQCDFDGEKGMGPTIIQAMLARRQARITRENATRD